MPTFGYTRDIPETDHSPSTDQPNMRTNTNSTDSLISIDHFSFGQNNFDGTHKQVQLRNAAGINGAIPAGLQGNGWETLYASATAGNGELWFVRGASATGIQLTGPGTPTISGNFGHTFIPGGIILQWGTTTASGTGTTNYLFVSNPANIDFPNNCFQVIAQSQNTTNTSTGDSSVAFISKTGFTLGTIPSGSPSGTIFSWFAIGN